MQSTKYKLSMQATVLSETIFPANHLTGAKAQSFQPTAKLVLVSHI